MLIQGFIIILAIFGSLCIIIDVIQYLKKKKNKL